MKITVDRNMDGMADELAVEIETIQDEIKGVMSANKVETLTGTDWKITWKAVTSNRLDSAALKKALPDVAAQYTRQTTARRFVLA